MWVPRWYFEAQARRINYLTERVEMIEQLLAEDARRKLASFSDGKAGLEMGELIIQKVTNK